MGWGRREFRGFGRSEKAWRVILVKRDPKINKAYRQ
jgi:hypothetical protein